MVIIKGRSLAWENLKKRSDSIRALYPRTPSKGIGQRVVPAPPWEDSGKRLDSLIESLPLPKFKEYNQSLTKALSPSLFISSIVEAQHQWLARQEQTPSQTTGAPGAGLMSQQLWALALLLGLGESSVGLWPQRLDFFHSKMELSHLTVDETSGIVYLGAVLCFHPNKSCHYTPNPPMCVSLKCTSRHIVGELYFLGQQYCFPP